MPRRANFFVSNRSIPLIFFYIILNIYVLFVNMNKKVTEF